jgi:parallel beta-helix repeat protein
MKTLCGGAYWILALLAFAGRLLGQTNHFYVAVEATGANDDNDGTRVAYQGGKVGPWRTIQRALRAAQPGDTIFVGGGRYIEELSITKPRIRLQAFSGARPLIDGENVRPYGIRNPDTVAAQNLLIEGFEIAHHTIAGVLISDRASTGVTLRGNIVHHARDKGIDVRGSGHRMESNVVFMIGNNQEAMGIHLASASDCFVQDNDVFLCKKTAIRDQSGKRNTIQGNLMHQCWTGLDYNGCSGTRAFNNYIYDNSQGFNPKHVKGDAGWNLFWHNTVYDSHGPHISIAVNRADNSQEPGPDCDYLDIRNNILVKAGHTHIWNKPDIVGNHLIIDHNLYFGPPGWPPFFYHTNWPGRGSPGMATLEEAQRKTSFERGGMVADPLLINPNAGDLACRDASPAHRGGMKLDSPFGTQLGARSVRKPVSRFILVRLKALKASVNEQLLGNTTDGRCGCRSPSIPKRARRRCSTSSSGIRGSQRPPQDEPTNDNNKSDSHHRGNLPGCRCCLRPRTRQIHRGAGG